MKEKLEVIRAKTVQIDNAMQWLQLLQSPTEAHLKRWCEDGYSVIAQNIALLDSLIAELESAELVDKVATALVSVYYNPDSPAFDACIKEVRKEAKAAINAIK